MNNLKCLREKSRFTQIELAKELGVGQSTVAMWETGKSVPRAQQLPKLAELFGCTIDELFENNTDAKKQK